MPGKGAASATGSWAGGRWLWPAELKPFFIDLMLSLCILGHAAELCGETVFCAGDDIKDMFHTFPRRLDAALPQDARRALRTAWAQHENGHPDQAIARGGGQVHRRFCAGQ